MADAVGVSSFLGCCSLGRGAVDALSVGAELPQNGIRHPRTDAGGCGGGNSREGSGLLAASAVLPLDESIVLVFSRKTDESSIRDTSASSEERTVDDVDAFNARVFGFAGVGVGTGSGECEDFDVAFVLVCGEPLDVDVGGAVCDGALVGLMVAGSATVGLLV